MNDDQYTNVQILSLKWRSEENVDVGVLVAQCHVLEKGSF